VVSFTAIRPALILALIVGIAAATRLTYLDLLEFRNDEATASLLAVGFLEGHGLPLTGIISSAQINNPPFFVYLLAIPLAVSRNPEAAAAFVGLLGVGSVLLTYRFAVENFDRRTAQVAALLFATAPWAVILSRRLQGQDVVPLFTLLWMSALFNFARGKGACHLVGVAAWLSVLIEVHFATVALIPLTAIALALSWRRFQASDARRWALGAIAVTVVLWLPYASFQVTHHFSDLVTLRHVVGQAPTIGFDHLAWIVDLAAANGFVSLAGTNVTAYEAQTNGFAEIYLAERVLVLAAVAFLVFRLLWTRGRAPTDQTLVLLLLWLAVPPLFFARHTTPLFNFYFVDVYPAQFLAVGLLISAAEKWLRARYSPVWAARFVGAAFTVMLAIVGAQVYGFVATMHFVATEPTPTGHEVPLRERLAAIDQFIATASASAAPVYIAGHDADADAFGYLARGHATYSIFDDRTTFVSPPDGAKPAAYLSTEPNQLTAQLLHDLFAEYRVALVPFPGTASGYEVYQIPPTAGAQLFSQPSIRPIGRDVANGMRLVGYDLPAVAMAGQPLQLTVYWQVASVPTPETDDTFFIHLVDDAGHTWAQQDALDYPPSSWTAGERIISRFTLQPKPDLPAKRGWIELGVYQRQDVRRLALVAADGTTSDHLRLGPLKLVPAKPTVATPPQHAQTATFGHAIALRGYDLTGPMQPGTTLNVALTWQAIVPPGGDDSSFVHLLDSTGQIVAQSDGQPGDYPTSIWQTGDVQRDERSITLPPTLPPGTYRLEIGLYRPDTQARLVTPDGDTVVLDTPVIVGSK
jgi:hypothetical protein